MKKVFVMFALMIFSSQLFAQVVADPKHNALVITNKGDKSDSNWPKGVVAAKKIEFENRARVVGTCEGGVVLQDESGNLFRVAPDACGPVKEKGFRWTPLIPKPQGSAIQACAITPEGVCVCRCDDGKFQRLDLVTGTLSSKYSHDMNNRN